MAAKRKTIVRRRPPGRAAKQLTDFLITGGTTVGGAALVNMLPIVKEQNVWIKALAMAAPGMIMMGARNRLIAQLGKGMGIAGAITLILPWMPEETTVFAGRRPLSRSEMRNLMMGIPTTLQNNGNNGQMNLPYRFRGSNYNTPSGQYASAGMDGRGAGGYDSGAGY